MKHYDKADTTLRLFSCDKRSELLMASKTTKHIKAIRVDDIQSLIYHNLYEEGKFLFDGAREVDGKKVISAVIVGLGLYGREMLKALSWFCQMDGYALKITAFDSTLKKLKFVDSAAELLGLNNLKTVHGRIEELNKQNEYRNRFDFVVARAVAESPKLAKAASGFPKRKGGRFVFYKTPGQAAEELPILKEKWQMTPEFELPGCGARVMVFSEKF